MIYNEFDSLQEKLGEINDIERIRSRIALRTAQPRDLDALRGTLAVAPGIRGAIAHYSEALLQECSNLLDGLEALTSLLGRSLADDPPALIREGGVIRPGYDEELDALRSLHTDASQFLLDLEQREKLATRIASLKVAYNRVHGYYIEVSRMQPTRCSEHYTRGQTLKNTSVHHQRS